MGKGTKPNTEDAGYSVFYRPKISSLFNFKTNKASVNSIMIGCGID
jgi:hypothetical protein